MDLAERLKTEKIQYLRLNAPLCVPPSTPLLKVVERMKARKTGCAIVVEGQKMIGIFTERDALTRVVEKGVPLSTPIKKLMTPDPKSLKTTGSVADAIGLMNEGGYRRIPLVDQAGHVVGVLSVRNIIKYLAEHFPTEIYNLPPDPHQTNRAREGA